MKKKRKFYLLVNICLVIVFLFMTVFTFFISYTFLHQDLTDCYRGFRTSLQSALENGGIYRDENATTDFDELIFKASGSFSRSFPYVYAIFDNEDGSVLSKSGALICIQDFDSDCNYIESLYLNLEPYMTESIKKEIFDYCSKTKKDTVVLKNMTFFVRREDYIPVEIELTSLNSDLTQKIRFSNQEPNRFYCDEYDIGWAEFLDLNPNSYNRRTYNRLYEYLEDAISQRPYENGGGGMISSNIAIWNGGIEISGKWYGFYCAMALNRFWDTLFSQEFFSLMFYQSILFLIAYIIIMIIASGYYRKNDRMTKAQRAFISAAAHELKTPLAVIQNQCECVLEDVAPEKNKDYVKSVHDEALRMNDIVSNLLWYNRLVNSKKIKTEKCDLSETVLAETDKYRTFAENNGVKMEVVLPSSKTEINCNRELIAMAIDNYLSNAIKYATGNKKVTVTLAKESKGTALRVFNECGGISYDERESIWYLLSRGDKARTGTGGSSGMGLPICSQIFEVHGFKYGYQNKSGGVEFYFIA